MSEVPKTDKLIQQDAFLGKMRQLGIDNLPDETIFVPVSELLGATDFFDIEIRPGIKDDLIKLSTKYPKLAVRIEAMELASLDAPKLKFWIQEWVMTIGVILAEAQTSSEWRQMEEEIAVERRQTN